MSKEVMKLALEALEKGKYYAKTLMMSQEPFDAAIKALAEQPAPVAEPRKQKPVSCVLSQQEMAEAAKRYTSPPQRIWVGLTDEEWQDFSDRYGLIIWGPFKREIEAKLKEKNNGN